MKSLYRTAAAACLVLAMFGAAALADDKPVTITHTPKEGDVGRFKTVINAEILGMQLVVTQESKHTIKEVKKNGDIVTVIKNEKTVVSVGGMEQPNPGDAPEVTEIRDKYGKLIEFKAPEIPGNPFSPDVQLMMAKLSDVIFSEREVKTGDTWNTEVENPIVKTEKAKVKTTYLGTEKVDGKDVAKIKQTAEAATKSEAKKMSGEMTYWVEPATGKLVKAEGKMTDVPISPMGMDLLMTFTMKIEPIKGDK